MEFELKFLGNICHNNTGDKIYCAVLHINFSPSIAKGRYVFSWGGGGLGPQRGGSSVKASTKRGGPYLM